MAIGWKERASHPSKPCRATSALAACTYSAAGQAASALHSRAVLQVFQAKMLTSEEDDLDAASLRDLRSVTDPAPQSHCPGHRVVNVQPGTIRAPPLAHDDGDERGGQGSLPRRSGLVRQPVWTSCGGLCGMLHGGSEVVSSDATLPRPLETGPPLSSEWHAMASTARVMGPACVAAQQEPFDFPERVLNTMTEARAHLPDASTL